MLLKRSSEIGSKRASINAYSIMCYRSRMVSGTTDLLLVAVVSGLNSGSIIDSFDWFGNWSAVWRGIRIDGGGERTGDGAPAAAVRRQVPGEARGARPVGHQVHARTRRRHGRKSQSAETRRDAALPPGTTVPWTPSSHLTCDLQSLPIPIRFGWKLAKRITSYCSLSL